MRQLVFEKTSASGSHDNVQDEKRLLLGSARQLALVQLEPSESPEEIAEEAVKGSGHL